MTRDFTVHPKRCHYSLREIMMMSDFHNSLPVVIFNRPMKSFSNSRLSLYLKTDPEPISFL